MSQKRAGDGLVPWVVIDVRWVKPKFLDEQVAAEGGEHVEVGATPLAAQVGDLKPRQKPGSHQMPEPGAAG